MNYRICSAGLVICFAGSVQGGVGQYLSKLAPVITDPDGGFGEAVAIEGSTVMVGAPGHNYAFAFDVTTTPSVIASVWDVTYDTGTQKDFGLSVALSQGTSVVGSRSFTGASGVSSASLYDSVNGLLIDRLEGVANTDFGYAVAIDGDDVAVGEPSGIVGNRLLGRAYVYDTAASPTVEYDLIPPFSFPDKNGFGASVSMKNGILAVGSPDSYLDSSGDDPNGQVDLYSYQGSHLGFTLTSSDGSDFEGFGHSISLSDDGTRLVVGAPLDSVLADESGSAYVFEYDSVLDEWNQKHKLSASDGDLEDYFGDACVFVGNYICIGAPNRSSGGVSGAVYVFDYETGTEVGILDTSSLPDEMSMQNFGTALASDGNRLVVGASGLDIEDSDPAMGSAYLFALPCNEADLAEPYGVLDFTDISAFNTGYANQDPSVDFNNDGAWDFFDTSFFLTTYSAGCP